MLLRSLPWLVSGAAAEAFAVHWLMTTTAGPSIEIFLLHAGGALLMAEGIRNSLPAGYQRPASGSIALLFLLLFLLPGIGLLGLALAVVPALYQATPKRGLHWQGLDLPTLPYQPLTPPDPDTLAMREGLSSVLSYSENPMLRQEAVLASRHLPRRQAVGLLRLGLADPIDDVRLMAYSMLSGIERDVDARIQLLTQHVEHNGDPYGHAAEALATLYWEYDYLALAQGSSAGFFLAHALRYIDQAIDHANQPHRQLLRGRIYLALKDHHGADAAFRQCAALGMDNDDLMPYLAEQAFMSRRFSMLHAQLARLRPTTQQHPMLHPLMEYWR
ncbi:hypothetical protein LPL18_000380 [Halomonas sp. CUBES01]|uniref:HEAT repeat domain-containing protein n=1 Tax=Vreelandella gomseomensis TaxID=370766 RepID=A0ABU1GA94_9GAMM|nr:MULTISPECIES: HEAT repeat domain-containing protein [Halomonas]MDR5874417.1 hypothetical protein [Halomonas gomseomensis]MEC4765807.1 hypothetical protein [Halomonas sp. CUBES01]